MNQFETKATDQILSETKLESQNWLENIPEQYSQSPDKALTGFVSNIREHLSSETPSGNYKRSIRKIINNLQKTNKNMDQAAREEVLIQVLQFELSQWTEAKARQDQKEITPQFLAEVAFDYLKETNNSANKSLILNILQNIPPQEWIPPLFPKTLFAEYANIKKLKDQKILSLIGIGNEINSAEYFEQVLKFILPFGLEELVQKNLDLVKNKITDSGFADEAEKDLSNFVNLPSECLTVVLKSWEEAFDHQVNSTENPIYSWLDLIIEYDKDQSFEKIRQETDPQIVPAGLRNWLNNPALLRLITKYKVTILQERATEDADNQKYAQAEINKFPKQTFTITLQALDLASFSLEECLEKIFAWPDDLKNWEIIMSNNNLDSFFKLEKNLNNRFKELPETKEVRQLQNQVEEKLAAIFELIITAYNNQAPVLSQKAITLIQNKVGAVTTSDSIDNLRQKLSKVQNLKQSVQKRLSNVQGETKIGITQIAQAVGTELARLEQTVAEQIEIIEKPVLEKEKIQSEIEDKALYLRDLYAEKTKFDLTASSQVSSSPASGSLAAIGIGGMELQTEQALLLEISQQFKDFHGIEIESADLSTKDLKLMLKSLDWIVPHEISHEIDAELGDHTAKVLNRHQEDLNKLTESFSEATGELIKAMGKECVIDGMAQALRINYGTSVESYKTPKQRLQKSISSFGKTIELGLKFWKPEVESGASKEQFLMLLLRQIAVGEVLQQEARFQKINKPSGDLDKTIQCLTGLYKKHVSSSEKKEKSTEMNQVLKFYKRLFREG